MKAAMISLLFVISLTGAAAAHADDSFTDGHSVHMVWRGRFDGKDYPVASDPTAGSWSFKQIDSHTLILTTKKDGSVLATRRVTVSADGRTRTMTGTRTEKDGAKGSVTAVYERP